MTYLPGKIRRALIHLTVGVGRLIFAAKETSRQDGYLLTMFRFARVWRLIKSVQHEQRNCYKTIVSAFTIRVMLVVMISRVLLSLSSIRLVSRSTNGFENLP